ncbi:Glyoxylase, beta-lactamase superfamily II [Dethiosulfatibacter aminovorans DSM 17477]|uniref:Glyoxylase, beta-lactamase superfamily II n=1 Tax=Dethiosulfatibacter aminovorans DSM 17477 TaxID=1121476 RepID=A0A1M6KAC8_9FIRM|nr:MBL fold metallo-hydrolase [Dethiosulfatibacter aminovorans]SHJ55935.1 Glyoxylase, beta-lactamase superfamily II [Dethiosulfatibacter aminovorans DSM 17477]
MIIKEIEKNFLKFIFDPKEDNKFGYNIFVLIDGNKAMLIDSGYRMHSTEVKKNLESKGIRIESVIISHFHLDHINGLTGLPDVHIIGSADYEKTLDIYVDAEKHHIYTPDIKVEEEYSFKFGEFDIEIKSFPGHANCSLLTVINGKYVHIGDELIFSNDGVPILPLISKSHIKRHITSLEKLKDFTSYVILPSHGKIIRDEELLLKDIENRLKYLKAVDAKSEKISYEEAVRECDQEFLHSEFHEIIYKD